MHSSASSHTFCVSCFAHAQIQWLSGIVLQAGKVDAEARLFFHEKAAAPRPRARLGAPTDPIKKRGENPLWC